MSIPFRVSAIPAVLTIALTACGGGGGGNSVASQTPVPAPDAAAAPAVAFTAFSAIAPKQPVVMSGISQTGSGPENAGFNLDPMDHANSTARLTFDSSGDLIGMSMSTPGSSVSYTNHTTPWIVPNVDDASGRRASFSASDGTFGTIVVDPLFLGWDYQSFGVWMRNDGASPFQVGAMSAGAPSPVSALPMSSGTFTGHAAGFYFDSQGNPFGTDARMQAIANFRDQTVVFSTSGTVISANGVAPAASPGLDLSGTLKYAPDGSNLFSGDVKAANQELSGKAGGQFYGPGAQEIGGVYGLGSTSGARMVGGFGGKRP